MISRRALTRIVLVLVSCLTPLNSITPNGYIADGNYDTDCTTVRDPADKPEESLNSCEDETFWELRDAQGRPQKTGPRTPYPHEHRAQHTPPNHDKNYPPNHDFHPLGVEVWPSYAGNSSNLYVVNHARKRTVIEQFVISPDSPTEAVHVRTISSSYFVSPNALALTSPDAFYVSNDHLITRRWPIVGHFLPIVESILGLPLGFVSHVTLTTPASSGGSAIAKHTFAKPFIAFANGVSLSSSGKHLAIVFFYERDPATNRLTRLTNVVQVPFTPDNIHYTHSLSSGAEEVIVGGHPNFPDLVRVAASKANASAPSWVLTIVPKLDDGAKPEAGFDLGAPVPASTKIAKDGARWTLRTLFQSDGVEAKGGFGSSTTGLRDPDSGVVYVTGLYAEGGMLVCKPGSGAAKK
ncbi:hypothetical protein BDZ97DRAFT_1905148 [Flammula alnicola]|nr:hypothetical protein BDZ97DRAFT_1905148 [Flammula alnicola]